MSRRSGNTLVATLVTVVIALLIVLAFAVGPRMFGGAASGGEEAESAAQERPDGKGETLVGRAMLRGDDTACRSNLSQVRSAIQIQTDPVEETAPADLSALGLGPGIITCPVGGEAYSYSAHEGAVSCPHPGHEKY
jgi:hypothetical protein